MLYLERRSIPVAIILSIITCGIYGIFWLYKLAESHSNLYLYNNGVADTSPGMVLLFSIITCGIYSLYFFYKAGQTVDDVRARQNLPVGSKAILYLILCIVGFGIISYALLQNDYNEMAAAL